MFRLLILFLLPAMMLVSGCGGGASDSPQLFPVSGTVTLDGTPLAEASILFKDPTGKNKSYFASVEDGAYTTEMEAGPRVAQITANRPSKDKMVENAEGTGMEPAMEQYLPSQYNEKSTLEITVSSDGENTFPFELTSE